MMLLVILAYTHSLVLIAAAVEPKEAALVASEMHETNVVDTINAQGDYKST